MKKRKKGQKVCYFKKMQYLCTIKIKTSRSGAVVARWAHNPKVIGSNPFSATTRLKHRLGLFDNNKSRPRSTTSRHQTVAYE